MTIYSGAGSRNRSLIELASVAGLIDFHGSVGVESALDCTSLILKGHAMRTKLLSLLVFSFVLCGSTALTAVTPTEEEMQERDNWVDAKLLASRGKTI